MKKLLALILLALVVAACATNEQFKQARVEVAAGNEEAGLARLEQEIKAHPDDVELRNYYQRHKEIAVQRYLALGDNARAAGAADRAQASYERALRFDPQNQRAEMGKARSSGEKMYAHECGQAPLFTLPSLVEKKP